MSSSDPPEPAEKDIADESISAEETGSDSCAEEHVELSERPHNESKEDTERPLFAPQSPSDITPKSSRPPSALVLDLTAITNGSTANPSKGTSAAVDSEGDNDQQSLNNSLPPSRVPSTGRATPITPLTKELQPWDLIEPPATNNNRDLRDAEEGRKFIFEGGQHGQRAKRKIPKSSYYFGPPGPGSAYGTSPIGVIGLHHPREIVRVERDYTGGEAVTQFAPIWPLELEGRITPTQFLSSINEINEILISAHSIKHAFFDNAMEVLTLGLSNLVMASWYEKEMSKLQTLFQSLNAEIYNPAGLNLLWPRSVGFLFLEIEYY